VRTYFSAVSVSAPQDASKHMKADIEVKGGTGNFYAFFQILTEIEYNSINAKQYENRFFQDNNCINPGGTQRHLSI
jgi:hypothetical protein